MYLTRLLYFSECNQDVPIDVAQILRTARHHNAGVNITGALWFDGDYFIQVLEGKRQAVSDLYHRIASDPRHRNIELVDCSMINERHFSKWRMGYHGDTKSNRERIRRFSSHDKLLPREMSPGSLMGLLRDLDLSDQTV